MSEAIFDVNFIEEGDHIFCLIFRVVDFFDAIEDDCEDDFVGHNAGVLQKIAVALLDAFYCRF